MKKNDQTVLLFKKAIFSKPKAELLEMLNDKVIRSKKPLVIFTPNPEQLVLAQKNTQFSNYLEQADVLIPDGIGLVWAAKLHHFFGRKKTIFERISGIDLSIDLLEWSSKQGAQVLLLGGKDYYQAGKQALQLSAHGQLPQKLRLYWLEGYKKVGAPTRAEEAVVAQTLRSLKPKLVLVAFGAPHQEQWVIEHLDLLTKSGTKIVMVVGGAFDVLFGRLKRAPLWVRAIGLEWFYRLLQEPHRAHRQLALLSFVGLTFQEIFSKKTAR
ncbi:MAG: hypothetical protein A2383_03120 [Candidatus Pacebacteria bacterium RIFOXYB1_FULL_39_46]|nr:MAG: hypothetical protein A2182_01165 [Candidatus Pacebacteria bacterium RIFOXYA1_FULL_38_18]OGJ38415.1 MAG: hypothetical protein A2383_03120 [Candidatus Pacebacteria bacterium RIFOXYB1_FULL_39_46]OGJ40276.1 MAG: hypothetical protein A2411_03265 [Candidatus Pacebacteria bacterium RIFOXYC1_FULL_39_21]OGJ40849.1 MAG: hypothetical protein A2582_02000 [Candidatus Pacebacteria bacterium RIFOXYD1_FULL_39_27]